jgi:uncharacterized protein YbjT (DUF2867 family)
MAMKVLIVGSTGMVGKGALLECLDSPAVESVLVVNRQPLGLQHPKLREIIHGDFYNLAPIESDFKGLDACFFCLGATSAGMSEEKYSRLTYDLTLVFAQALARQTQALVFCFVSGAGTDSSEKGKVMWARVKGKAENALLGMPFKAAYMFRPAFIRPMRGVKSKTASYRIFYAIFRPFFLIFGLFPSFSTTTVKLGRAMINAAARGYEKKILESPDINRLSEA